MQAKYYALTAVISAVFASMSAQAQTPGQVNAPQPSETQSGPVPPTQPSLPMPDKPKPPGIIDPATREDIRSQTRAQMKAGQIPRGEQSTATQGSKPEYTGSEMLWER